MTKMFLFAPALLVAAAIHGPAAAAEKTAPVLIPFKPPVGKPLHYRESSLKTGGQRIEGTMTVAFRPAGDAWLMTVAQEVPALARLDPVGALLTRPVTFQVNADGEITGVADEKGYLDSLEKAITALVPADQPGAGQVRGLIAQMRAMPAEARTALLARNVAPLVRYAATGHSIGEAVTGTEDAQTPFGPATVTTSQMLDRVTGGIAHFTTVSRVPAEQLEAMIRRLAAGAAAGEKPPADLRLLANETNAEADVETATGLLRHYSETKSVTVSQGGKEETGGTTVTLDLLPSGNILPSSKAPLFLTFRHAPAIRPPFAPLHG